ncbi:50S ribosomal protein L9 [Candidatus Gromoviella agglomerans]|uniref:50S ribosomal protein L9 n=1 Tax=Candidatus Gromoviella agglomerans TaxID=2806609 RepID=UPI001E449D9A|nr:50S ribosomal protein L9 [Candidatus Gromoviella agglomerans]UFX98426.1 50S ribosomal protein L9 [Candidatus Gromoviella agglomerans]
MNVLLLRRLRNANPGDVIFVKNGYAKYLINSGVAVYPTEGNKKKISMDLEKIKEKDFERNQRYIQLAQRINELGTLTIVRSANHMGSLYGAVSPKDIVDLLEENKIFVESNYVRRTTINKVGEHIIHIKFPVVDASFKLMIEKLEDDHGSES